MSNIDLDSLIRHTKNNELDILKSKECHCLFCDFFFPAKDVHDWTSEKGETRAVCPRCGAPYVLGDVVYSSLPTLALEEAKQALFANFEEEDFLDYLSDYRDRYEKGLIAHTAQGEKLYLQALQSLARDGDPLAALSLTSFWIEGKEEDYDPYRAYALLTEDAFIDDPDCAAMAGLAAIYCSSKELKHAKEKAFECFARSSALGSERGTIFLANAYLDGVGVKPSPYVAFSILSRRFPKMIEDFLFLPKEDEPVFRDRLFCLLFSSYRLMRMLFDGIGTEKNPDAALFFALLARYFATFFPEGNIAKELNDVDVVLEELGKELGFRQEGEIRYDEYTFGDTFAYLWSAFDLPFSYEILSENSEEKRLRIQIDFRFDPLLIDYNALSVKLGAKLGSVWEFSGKRIRGEAKGSVEWMRLGREKWTFGNYSEIDGSPVTTLELLMSFDEEP